MNITKITWYKKWNTEQSIIFSQGIKSSKNCSMAHSSQEECERSLKLFNENHELIIPNTQNNSIGYYTCIVYTNKEKTPLTVTHTLYPEIIVLKELKYSLFEIGKNATFECDIQVSDFKFFIVFISLLPP